LLLLLVAAVSACLIFWHLSRRGWQTLSGVQASAASAVNMDKIQAVQD
jgi:hypothetical protein